VASAIASAAACSMGAPASPSESPQTAADNADASSGPAVPFAPDTPYTYVAKVKNILIGLPPTDAEVKAVVAASDPQAELQTLIKGWMALKDPNSAEGMTYYAEKMLVFFKLATQQTQISVTDFADQAYPGQIDINFPTESLLVQNAIESFARTMVNDLVTGTQPVTEVATTTSFMMTTALMEMYAFLDVWQVDDSGSVVDIFEKAHPGLKLTVGSASVPLSQTVDPTNANFMHWTDPDVAAGGAYSIAMAKSPSDTGCATDPISYTATGRNLHYLMFGGIDGHLAGATGTSQCQQYGGSKSAPQVGNALNGGANDFNDWRMVTISQPQPGGAVTDFFNLPALRQASSLVLNLPRVGFFTTPAFFSNWQTNSSNTMRVTMNQTLIVALGAMFDGLDSTVPKVTTSNLPPGLDEAHSAPGSACYGCHRLLDPTRSILSSTYSWNYHEQDDGGLAALKGEFAFQGVISYPNTVFDLANILATHPLFAQAWVQKLCYYANSQACDTTDPEFLRIVKDFTSSSYSWNELIVDILSSPLTTNAKPTQTTTENGVTVAVSRRDHLCAALNFRLGFNDICGLLPTTVPVSQTIVQIVGGLPSDGYGRGAVAPVLPNVPSLFYRSGTENICEAVAALVIDVPTSRQIANVKQWSSANFAEAIPDFVGTVMGLVPSDARYPQAVSLLTAHYSAALTAIDPATNKADFSPTNALQSTFVAACIAPSAVSIGL
jgi:hypothetical protein